jgi:hypothetical protein
MEQETKIIDDNRVCQICGGRTLYDNSGDGKNEMILVDKDKWAHKRCAEESNYKVKSYFRK